MPLLLPAFFEAMGMVLLYERLWLQRRWQRTFLLVFDFIAILDVHAFAEQVSHNIRSRYHIEPIEIAISKNK